MQANASLLHLVFSGKQWRACVKNVMRSFGGRSSKLFIAVDKKDFFPRYQQE